MNKSEIFKRYFVFLIGLYINSLGISLITKAALGTSPISSIPYVLSLGFAPTLGMFTIGFSLLLIVVQLALLRKSFPLRDVLQIPVSVLLGVFIDISMAILFFVNPTVYAAKIIYLLIGCAVLGFGVYIEMITNVVMLPGESVVRAISMRFKTDFAKTKIANDVTLTIIAAAISLVLFRRIDGVREGTIIAAVLVGFFARIYSKKLYKLEKILFE